MVKLRMTPNLLKWTSAVSKLSKTQTSSPASNGTGTSFHNSTAKRWIHNDTMLINGHASYLVKFLGHVEVDQPKGLEVVKESIKKLEFQEHLKRSEGEKIKRVELTISVDGVAIREPRTKHNIHQFPLNRISYCADDKSDRKFLSFITKMQDSSDKHECYVFISDKMSEEITLTIGQAFDIAYRKYLDAFGNEIDRTKELIKARKRIQELETKVTELEQKLEQKEPKSSRLSSNHSRHNNSQLSSISSVNQTIDLSQATSKLQSLMDIA